MSRQYPDRRLGKRVVFDGEKAVGPRHEADEGTFADVMDSGLGIALVDDGEMAPMGNK